MKLKELLKIIDIDSTDEREVTGISDDSRTIEAGMIFTDRIKSQAHQEEALRNGAIYILDANKVANIEDSTRRLFQAFYPIDEKIKIIGITGTNGKSTTALILYQLLERLGEKAMCVGTLGVYYDNKTLPVSNTTPDYPWLYHLLNICRQEKIKYFIFEVSSHALAKKRLDKIKLDYAIYLNIASDHLDYHGSWDNYLAAKKEIINYLKPSGLALVNGDDEHFQHFIAPNTIFYGLKNSYLPVENITYSLNTTSFSIGAKKFISPLAGEYNLYNLLPSIILTISFGFDVDQIVEAIKKINPIKGRLELVSTEPLVYIDFAHTEGALKTVLSFIKKHSDKKVLALFGCGGDRDKSKRPLMGKIVSEIVDQVIITSDNPRSEAPLEIISDIVAGIKKNNYQVIEERHLAIYEAIRSYPNYLIILLGKGHENNQIFSNGSIEFDERKIVHESINSLYKNSR